MGMLHMFSGVAFAFSWYCFFDGLTFAKRNGHPYTFLMWLPAILCILGGFLMFFVSPDDIMNDDGGDMFGGGVDQDQAQKSKVIFFGAAFFGLAGLSVAIWKMADTYASDTWPGLALLLQCVGLMTWMGLAFAASRKKQDDGMMF